MKSKLTRQSNVEILRILACFIVISVHIKLGMTRDDGTIDLGRALISCLVADGVGVFWLISGFFISRPIKSYSKHLTKSFKTILLPALIYSVFLMFYNKYANGVSTAEIIDSLKFNVSHLREYMYASSHLWYIIIYTFIILLQPLIVQAINYLDEHPRGWNVFIPVVFALFVWNDFTNNELFEFSHHTINALVPAISIIFIAHWLYKYILPIINIKTSFVCLIIFVAAIILRTYCFAYVFKKSGSIELLYWYTSLGVVCEASLSLFVISVFKKCKSVPINFIASLTYRIYLVHMFVVVKLRDFDFGTRLGNMLEKAFSSTSLVFELAYTFIFALAVFVISALISVIWSEISKLFYKILEIVHKKKEV